MLSSPTAMNPMMMSTANQYVGWGGTYQTLPTSSKRPAGLVAARQPVMEWEAACVTDLQQSSCTSSSDTG